MVDISGSTEESSKAFGKTTKCTEKEHLCGVMDVNTKANM